MKIQIVGVGVVGTAQAYLAAQLGHQVVGYDHHKTASEHATMMDRLATDVDLTFICTPEAAVEEAVRRLVEAGVEGVWVVKSTVPPGTTQGLQEKYGRHLCHNPEFLREKTALHDVAHPNMLVIGQCCPEHGGILKSLYVPLGCPIVVTRPPTSETVKLALNSYLAVLISYWNEIDKLAATLGISTSEVATIATLDPRLSRYGTEFFGAPFGGKCLPKDLDHLIRSCRSRGINPLVLEAVKEFNRRLNDADPV